MSNSTDKNLNLLKTFLKAESLLTANEWEIFSGIWETFSTKRKQIITNSDETEKYIYFVVEGIQRIYYCSESGNEATLILTYPHSFGGVMDSFLLQKPSRYFYESLTPSLFLRAPFAQFLEITNNSKALDSLIKQFTYVALSGLLERMAELQCYSSEEKFKILLKRSPQVLQLIPHKYLANYLGIDPTNFSKLLNTIKV